MDEPNPFAQEEEPGDIASVAYRCVDSQVYTCLYFVLFTSSVSVLIYCKYKTGGMMSLLNLKSVINLLIILV